jgi:hypothetical protein
MKITFGLASCADDNIEDKPGSISALKKSSDKFIVLRFALLFRNHPDITEDYGVTVVLEKDGTFGLAEGTLYRGGGSVAFFEF